MKYGLLIFITFLSACSSQNFYYDDQQQIAPADSRNVEQTKEIKSNSEVLQNYLSAELAYKREDFEKSIYYFTKVSEYSQQSELITKRLAELGLITGDIDLTLQALKQGSQHSSSEYVEDLLALTYLAAHDQSAAEETLQNKLIKYPDSVNNKLQLAAFYLLDDELVKARDLLSEPKSREELSLQGYVYELINDLTAAEQAYRAALAKEETLEVLVDLVRILAKQESPALLEILNSKAKLLPDAEALNKLIMQGDYVAIYESNDLYRTPAIAQKFGDLQIRLANEDSARKAIDQAIIRVLALAEALPEYSTANFIAFTSYRELQRIQSAISVLNKINADNPLKVRALLLAALTLRAEKDYSGAQPYIEQALKLNPQKETIFNLYVQNLKGLQDITGAEKAVADYLADFPENEYYLYEHATLLFELKKPEESHKVLTKLLEKNPVHAGALNFKAYTYAESGTNLDLALEYVNKSLLLEPNNAYYLDTLAWVYYKQKNYQQARYIQEKAMKLVADPVLMEHYADILSALGEGAAAQDWYRQSLIVAKDFEPSIEIEKLKERLKIKVK